ncbi:MAG: ribonuclease P protein component [Moorellaceae bacterium]
MLPAARRIRRTADFLRVYRQGRRAGSENLTLLWRPNGLKVTRFGFSVSKKIGRAVTRNRSRRLLREVCRRHLHLFRPGFDVVVVAKAGIRELNYRELEEEVLSLSRKAKLLVNEGTETS